jgi:hypothetical protein
LCARKVCMWPCSCMDLTLLVGMMTTVQAQITKRMLEILCRCDNNYGICALDCELKPETSLVCLLAYFNFTIHLPFFLLLNLVWVVYTRFPDKFNLGPYWLSRSIILILREAKNQSNFLKDPLYKIFPRNIKHTKILYLLFLFETLFGAASLKQIGYGEQANGSDTGSC